MNFFFNDIKEDMVYYRQRVPLAGVGNEYNTAAVNLSPSHETAVKLQYQQHGGQLANDNDQTIAEMVADDNKTHMGGCGDNMEENQLNYMNLQQQHYMPHTKLHSMDRFALPNSPPKATVATTAAVTAAVELSPPGVSTPQQFDKNSRQQKLINMRVSDPYRETSIIDLNELDEGQLKQLKAEEEKTHEEMYNIDHLNRLYIQAQFLYKGDFLNFKIHQLIACSLFTSLKISRSLLEKKTGNI
jgi:hypothetical protein